MNRVQYLQTVEAKMKAAEGRKNNHRRKKLKKELEKLYTDIRPDKGNS